MQERQQQQVAERAVSAAAPSLALVAVAPWRLRRAVSAVVAAFLAQAVVASRQAVLEEAGPLFAGYARVQPRRQLVAALAQHGA